MLLMCFSSCFATTIEIPGRNLYVQNGMAGQAYSLSHVDGVFRVTSGSEQFDIKSYNVQGFPKGISSEQIKNDDLYFRLNQNGQDSILQINGRLRGGMESLAPTVGPYIIQLIAWGISQLADQIKNWNVPPMPVPEDLPNASETNTWLKMSGQSERKM